MKLDSLQSLRFKLPSFQLTGRGRIIFWSGIALLLVFVGYLFITIPLTQSKILRDSHMELKSWKLSLQGKLKEIEKLKARQMEDRELLEAHKLSGRIKVYNEVEALNLVADLNNLIIGTNNRIIDMTYSSSPQDFSGAGMSSGVVRDLRRFPVNLVIRGRYSTLQDFFSRLSTSENLLTVEKVKIELINPPELEMELLLVFYMFGQKEVDEG